MHILCIYVKACAFLFRKEETIDDADFPQLNRSMDYSGKQRSSSGLGQTEEGGHGSSPRNAPSRIKFPAGT
jgi:hypothetical protein